MVAAETPTRTRKNLPISLMSRDFSEHRFDWYRWMLAESPVTAGRIGPMKIQLLARHEDCRAVLSDPRFIRNRGRARGKGSSPLPLPLPKSVAALSRSMILEDDPAHRRLRGLVNKAFMSHSIESLAPDVEALAAEILDGFEAGAPIDLLADYAHTIPSRVIAALVGISEAELREFSRGIGILTQGLSGFRILKTLLWDLRRTASFVRGLIARKRKVPGEDMLSALIAAEEEGDRLSEDELLAMVFLLIVAGFETTQHLIGNGVKALIESPGSLSKLRADPALWDSAIQEIVRFRGPIHGTKLIYPTEDVLVAGTILKRGEAVMPVLGAANLDPRVFEDPDRFDIERSPNHHLGFGFGAHFCLGRQLALMEVRIALKAFFERFPNARFAVGADELKLARLPGWYRFSRLPMILN